MQTIMITQKFVHLLLATGIFFGLLMEFVVCPPISITQGCQQTSSNAHCNFATNYLESRTCSCVPCNQPTGFCSTRQYATDESVNFWSRMCNGWEQRHQCTDLFRLPESSAASTAGHEFSIGGNSPIPAVSSVSPRDSKSFVSLNSSGNATQASSGLPNSSQLRWNWTLASLAALALLILTVLFLAIGLPIIRKFIVQRRQEDSQRHQADVGLPLLTPKDPGVRLTSEPESIPSGSASSQEGFLLKPTTLTGSNLRRVDSESSLSMFDIPHPVRTDQPETFMESDPETGSTRRHESAAAFVHGFEASVDGNVETSVDGNVETSVDGSEASVDGNETLVDGNEEMSVDGNETSVDGSEASADRDEASANGGQTLPVMMVRSSLKVVVAMETDKLQKSEETMTAVQLPEVPDPATNLPES